MIIVFCCIIFFINTINNVNQPFNHELDGRLGQQGHGWYGQGGQLHGQQERHDEQLKQHTKAQ